MFIMRLLNRKFRNRQMPVKRLSNYEVNAYVMTEIGCYRRENEDSILYIKPSDKYQLKNKGVLAIVADGMGGHRAGAVASQLAVETIMKSYYRQKTGNPLKALKKAIIEANNIIYTIGMNENHYNGMGTTSTAFVLRDGKGYFAHVGDTRLYRFHNGEIELLTEDQTLVMELIKSGLISYEEAQNHPQRNIITQALGTKKKVKVLLSSTPFAVQIGDYFIVCSDGLYELVNESEMRQILLSCSPNLACKKLIDLAKQRGGYDNISIGIIAINSSNKENNNVPPTRERRIIVS